MLMCLAMMTLPACAACPQFLSAQRSGTVESPAITEASGIAASRKNPEVLWLHNDSGDSARVFAVNHAGEYLGEYALSGAGAVDWEDIALGPGPVDGLDYLYCGDIGDNNAVRANITVYRVIEPQVDADQAPVTTALTGVDALVLQYPDGTRDAETLMVDPRTRNIYVISKSDNPSRVYRATYPQSTTQTNTMELVATLGWGGAVGGDISPTGNLVIVRRYFSASLWQRENNTSLSEAFSGPACSIPLAFELQGEAIGFNGNGCGYFSVREGTQPPLNYYARDLEPLPANLDHDCDVDYYDYARFAAEFSESANDSLADLDGSGSIDFNDLVILNNQWLSGLED